MKAKILILTAVVAVLMVSDNVSADLIAHYKFDSNSGLVAVDEVAGNDGAIVNWNDAGNPTGGWVAGKIGGAYNFNGTDSSSTPLAALDGLDQAGANPSNATVAYWKKGNNLVGDLNYPYAEDFMVSGMNLHSWASWNPYVAGGTVYQSINAGAGYGDQIGAAAPATLNDWHHYALVKDFGASTTKIYIDGGLVGTNAAATSAFNAPGKFDIGSSIYGGAIFQGAIDDFRIYNTPLTAGQLAGIIPEPGSMTLIGLGSLFALLRRKR